MTNTIPNVPRELLERVLNAGWGSETVNALDDLRDFLESASSSANHVEDVRAMVAAPSPAGVDGLKRYEVFPYLDDEVAELDICESDDGTFVKYDAAKAIIDGLLGENERIRLNIAEYNEAISCYQSERDKQAQRIGELEGLLGETLEDMTNELWQRIDATLSAGKEVE